MRIGHLLIFVCLGWCYAHSALAQNLSPRAYVITPVDSNVFIVNYSHLEGALQFNGSVPITGAEANVNVPLLSYYHSFDLLGRSANFTIAQPYGFGEFKGTIAEVPKSAERNGFLDTTARLAVNLIGGPAMGPAEMAKWQQNVLLGVSLAIVAPTGQYNPTRLVNWGNNSWGFKPEIGYSERWGHWVLDAYAAVWFFTANPDYYPGNRNLSEATVGAVEAHLSYDFRPGVWVSLDANYWWGGETTINGVSNLATNQRNSRVGITGALRITQHQSIKLSFSDGAYISYGGNYRNITLAWQYSWLGTKFR